MARNLIETVMGAVVLIVAAGFLSFAYNQSSVKQVDGYSVRALFTDITGISVGSDVRVGGIKVGVVQSMELDPKTYQAGALLQIEDGVKLPKDTSAAIVSTGLIGNKFIKLEPGGDEALLQGGDSITFTQSSVSLEELIGKFVFSGGGVESDKKETDAKPDTKDEDKNPFSSGLE